MKETYFQTNTSNQLGVLRNNIDDIKNNIIPSTFNTYYDLIHDPTGFPNNYDSSISIDNVNRVFTIAPTGVSFDFYYKGRKFTKTTADNFIFSNTEGIHHIFYNEDGELEELLAFDVALIKEYVYVSNFYWSVTQQRILLDSPSNERHSLYMDNNTHYYLHSVNGSKFKSGFSVINVTADGDGSLDAHSTFNVTQGEFFDEDILFQHSGVNQFNVLYRIGNEWRVKQADTFPLLYDGVNIQYNPIGVSGYELQNVAEGSYVLMHVIAVNDNSSRIAVFVGNNTYNDIDIARQEASSEIEKITGLPMAEFIPIGTLIFQYSSLFTNTTKTRIVTVDDSGSTYVDFRFTKSFNASGNIGIVSSHSLLSHLDFDDHKQYFNIERGDIRYYTKSQIDSFLNAITIDSISPLTTKGDILTHNGINNIRKQVNLNKEILNCNSNSNDGLSYNNFGYLRNIEKDILIADDMNYTTTSTLFTLIATGGSIVVGATNGVIANEKNFGVYTMGSGNNNSNFASYILGNSSGSGYFSLGGNFTYETYIYLPLLSTPTIRYHTIIGLSDSITSSITDNTVDGIYFFYNEAVSPNWQLKTRSNSIETLITTPNLVNANVWIKLKIEYNHATSNAVFYINNTVVGNINTNIPLTLARATGLNIKMQKSVGNGNRYIGIDYIYFNHYYNEVNKR